MKFQLMDKHRCIDSGIEELDTQQSKFITLGNEFLTAFNEREYKNKSENMLSFLNEYSRKHFITQEAQMQLYNFPLVDKHIEKHEEFIKEVSRIYKMLLSYKKTKDNLMFDKLSLSICMLITDWYAQHITVEDIRVNEFFRYEAENL